MEDMVNILPSSVTGATQTPYYRAFDVSKQIVGQGIVHLLNIGISDLVSQPSSGNNPCTAYFMNVTFDVTVGALRVVISSWTGMLTGLLLRRRRYHMGRAARFHQTPHPSHEAERLRIRLVWQPAEVQILGPSGVCLYHRGRRHEDCSLGATGRHP